MATAAQTISAQQLFETPGLERFELVEGGLVPMSPPGFDHGRIGVDVSAVLREFVQPRELGVVAAEAGFFVSHDPDTVRSPDVAFVRTERIPPGGVRAFFDGAPDLAVEVISPFDRASEVLAKARDWLRFGCIAVWTIDPETRTVTVYGNGPQMLCLTESDTLACEELLPGFRLPIVQIFGR